MREAHVHAGLHVSAHTRETRLPTSRRLLWQQSHKCKRNTPVLKLIRLQIESAAGEHTPVIMPQHSREGGKYSLHATLTQLVTRGIITNKFKSYFVHIQMFITCFCVWSQISSSSGSSQIQLNYDFIIHTKTPLLRNIPHLIQYSIHS